MAKKYTAIVDDDFFYEDNFDNSSVSTEQDERNIEYFTQYSIDSGNKYRLTTKSAKKLPSGYYITKADQNGLYFEKSKIDNMNPQKLLNYILQNLETANNVRILWEIIKLLRKKKTKLVLYTYDSFLFDLDNKEEELVEEVLKIFKKYKLQVKLNYGTSYNFD